MNADRDQAIRALTFLTAHVRRDMRKVHMVAKKWDEPGILAQLEKCAGDSIASLTIAAIQAAEDPKATTPGVIPKPGPHRRRPEAGEAPKPNRGPWCLTCGQEPTAPIHANDHPFERPREHTDAELARIADAAAEAKQAAAEARGPIVNHPEHEGPPPRCGKNGCTRSADHTGSPCRPAVENTVAAHETGAST